MVISERIVKARLVHRCDECAALIRPGDSYTRMYGCAHKGDLPYAIRVCAECSKIEDAMEDK